MTDDQANDPADTQAPEARLLHFIGVKRPQLRKSERKVAALILDKPHAVIGSPIADVAEQAGVSEPTVIRFCRSLGFSGFQRFKLALARSLATEVPYVFSGIDENDTLADLSAKVIDRSVATLVETRNHLNVDQMQRAVELLDAASRIEFYGHGASGIVAADAQHKFFRLGTPTVAYSDPHVHGMSAGILPADAVVVAISHTGRSVDLIDSARAALDNGVPVIGITEAGSPLAELCTVTLAADVREDTDLYTPMTSRLAHLTLLDVLAVGVAQRRGSDSMGRLRKTKIKLAEKRLRADERDGKREH